MKKHVINNNGSIIQKKKTTRKEIDQKHFISNFRLIF